MAICSRILAWKIPEEPVPKQHFQKAKKQTGDWAPVYGITKNGAELSTHTDTQTHTCASAVFVWKEPVLKARRSHKGTSVSGVWRTHSKNCRMSVRSKDEEHGAPSEDTVPSGSMGRGQTSRKGPLDPDKVKK